MAEIVIAAQRTHSESEQLPSSCFKKGSCCGRFYKYLKIDPGLQTGLIATICGTAVLSLNFLFLLPSPNEDDRRPQNVKAGLALVNMLGGSFFISGIMLIYCRFKKNEKEAAQNDRLLLQQPGSDSTIDDNL